MNDVVSQQSRLKSLIAKGKEQGYLTYAEVNDHLPDDISDPDQVEDIIQMINDMGIQVFEQAPDADELLLTEGDGSADDIAAAEAAAALAAVETKPAAPPTRCACTCARWAPSNCSPARARSSSPSASKRASASSWRPWPSIPGSVKQILDEYALVTKEERKLADILVGYLDPADHVPSAQQIAEQQAGQRTTTMTTKRNGQRPGPGRGQETRSRRSTARCPSARPRPAAPRRRWSRPTCGW
jgi:RNA polymerase primary sigma factor